MACETDQMIEQFFYMFDDDGDMKIEKKELKSLLNCIFKEIPDDATVKKLLEDFDADGSGTIDLEEFKVMYKSMNVQPKGPSLKALFDKYDKNGTGDLDKEEVKEFLKEQNCRSSDEDIQALVCDTDSDKDGRINFKEFCRMFGKAVRENPCKS